MSISCCEVVVSVGMCWFKNTESFSVNMECAWYWKIRESSTEISDCPYFWMKLSRFCHNVSAAQGGRDVLIVGVLECLKS